MNTVSLKERGVATKLPSNSSGIEDIREGQLCIYIVLPSWRWKLFILFTKGGRVVIPDRLCTGICAPGNTKKYFHILFSLNFHLLRECFAKINKEANKQKQNKGKETKTFLTVRASLSSSG